MSAPNGGILSGSHGCCHGHWPREGVHARGDLGSLLCTLPCLSRALEHWKSGRVPSSVLGKLATCSALESRVSPGLEACRIGE
jgi:hypothetical protein